MDAEDRDEDQKTRFVHDLVAAHLDVAAEEVTVSRPGSGFSDSTFAVTTPDRRLVARLASVSRPEGVKRERAALRMLASTSAGRHVPRLWSTDSPHGDDDDGARVVLLREFVPGTAIDRLPDPADSVEAALSALAAVHAGTTDPEAGLRTLDGSLTWDALDARPPRSDPSDPVRSIVDRLSGSAVLEGDVCLLHGDPNPSNLIIDSAGVTLIDWERAAVGHPALDLGSFCFSWLVTFGNPARSFLERARAGYAAAGGRMFSIPDLAAATLLASRLFVPPFPREFDDWLFHAHLELLFVRNRRVWLDVALAAISESA